eukprot:sb/3477185/
MTAPPLHLYFSVSWISLFVMLLGKDLLTPFIEFCLHLREYHTLHSVREKCVCVFRKGYLHNLLSCKSGKIDLLQATIASKQINLSSCCQSADFCHVCLSKFRPVCCPSVW